MGSCVTLFRQILRFAWPSHHKMAAIMDASLAQRQQSCSKRAFSSESHLSFTSTSFIIIPHLCSSQSQWGLMRPSRPSLPICSKRSRMYLRVFPFEHTKYPAQAQISMTAKAHTSNPFSEHQKKTKQFTSWPRFCLRSSEEVATLEAAWHFARTHLQSLQTAARVTKFLASYKYSIWLVDFQLSASKRGSHPIGSHCENLPPSRSPAARLLEESPCFARPSSESLEAFNRSTLKKCFRTPLQRYVVKLLPRVAFSSEMTCPCSIKSSAAWNRHQQRQKQQHQHQPQQPRRHPRQQTQPQPQPQPFNHHKNCKN